MPKIKSFSLISALSLVGIIVFGWIVFSQPSRPTVRLTTQPAPAQMIPFEAEADHQQSPVKFTLQAVDDLGQPLTDAQIHLQLLTPVSTPWLPTDFPISEGTTLLELNSQAPEGEVSFRQMLPIRGTYRLLVDVKPIAGDAFKPLQQTLTLTVPENGIKFRNFAILALILLATGMGGGWVISQQRLRQPGEIAPQSVRLLLSGGTLVAIAALLVVNVSAEISPSAMEHSGHSHHLEHRSEPALEVGNGVVKSQGLELRLSADPQASIGQLTRLQTALTDSQTNQPITDVNFQVTIRQLENDWVSFAYQGSPNATGKLQLQQQFFDGAPHQIELEAMPLPNAARQFKPFKVAKIIDVEGIAPPLSVRLVGLAYMTGLLSLGVLFGYSLGRYCRTQRVAS